MSELEAVYAFAVSLGVGLLLGLERQRKQDTLAGLRTFGLTAVLGTACAMLAERAGSPWLLPAGLLACALVMISADRQQKPEDADTTTTIALLLCFGFGAMLWYGHTRLTVALALATTALLYFKAELHGISSRLSRHDMISFLQFAVITFIVLPLLPDQGYGPYGALNPYQIWLMVVLIAGIGLAGYVALRMAGPERGPPLLGVLGGMISSTATTLVFARKARVEPRSVASAQLVILTANLVLLLRIAFVAALIAPSSWKVLIPTLGLGLIAGSLVPLRLWLQQRGSKASASDLPSRNPLELTVALSFGAIFAVALVLTAWLNDRFGAAGTYGLALILGLTDMDAITLSSLKLFGGGQLSPLELAITLVLALAANLVFKGAIARVVGGSKLARPVALGFVCVLAGLGGGLAIANAAS
jgi:uncharacterized membrane protein (DUF4010 family)